MMTAGRARNMYRILFVFAFLCLVLAGALFLQSRELAHQFQAVTQSPQVERRPQLVKKQLRRTRVLAWAATGGTVLLVVAAALASRMRDR
jgi:hypothetical protein